MRAFFDALEDVEMVMQCRYQALKTLHVAIVTAQMVESCRLARRGRSVHVNKMDAPELEKFDAMPSTLNTVVKAFHTALTPQPSTTAVSTTSVLKGSSKDLEGNSKQIKILQEGLKKQAADTDRRFLQMVDEMAQLSGSAEQIGSLLRLA